MKCKCPEGCKYCGRLRSRDAVGHYCKTKNCPWQHGYDGCTLHKHEEHNMRILAVDPGNVESAYVLLDGLTIVEKGKVFNQEMLAIVTEHGRRLSGAGLVDELVVEMIASYGMAVGREVFETVFWIGRFCQAWSEGPRKFYRMYRKDVKMHLCYSMRAKDGNVRMALIDKLGAQGTKKCPGPTYGVSADIWAALGVGVTWQETHKEHKKPVALPVAKPKKKPKAAKPVPRLKPRTPPEYDLDDNGYDEADE